MTGTISSIRPFNCSPTFERCSHLFLFFSDLKNKKFGKNLSLIVVGLIPHLPVHQTHIRLPVGLISAEQPVSVLRTHIGGELPEPAGHRCSSAVNPDGFEPYPSPHVCDLNRREALLTRPAVSLPRDTNSSCGIYL